MGKRKIGFIQNAEVETVGEKQADKLGKKADVVVKWISEEKSNKRRRQEYNRNKGRNSRNG